LTLHYTKQHIIITEKKVSGLLYYYSYSIDVHELGPSPTQGSSLYNGLITRGMLKRIQNASDS